MLDVRCSIFDVAVLFMRQSAIITLTLTLAATTARPAPPPLYTLPPRYDHVVIVIVENVNPEELLGEAARAAAPYINSLADQGATFDRLYSLKHTSAPMYGELFAGDGNGLVDGAIAPGVPFTTPNLGAALRNSGLSFTGYAESLPAPGSTVIGSGSYVRGHNPWVSWQNDAADAHPNQLPSSTNLPFSYFPTDFTQLPNVAFVVPDNAHNMHDGGTDRYTRGDNFIKSSLGAYAAWAKNNNSLLIITADEDDRNLNNNLNKIPTVFYGAGVNPGVAIPQPYTLHNLLRTVEDMYGVPHSAAASYVRPITGPFIGDPALNQVTITSAADTQLRADQPNTPFADAPTLQVSAANQGVQSLVRFDNVTAQVPADATILSAKLTLWSTAAGATATPVKLHRMLTPWSESSTWNSLAAGISPNGVEARIAEDFLFAPPTNAHPQSFDVSDTVQSWLDGAPNQGWALLPTGADAFDFISTENTTTDQRPSLEVTYALYPRWAPTASTSWSNPANWKYAQPNAPAAVARFGPTAAGPAVVTLDADQTLGTLLIDNPQSYVIAQGQAGALILNNRKNVASIQVKQGQHTLAAPVRIADPTVIAIAPSARLALTGGLQLNSNLLLDSGELAVDQITGNGAVTLQPNTTLRLTADKSAPSHVSSLNLPGQPGAWQARLDLGRAALMIDPTTSGESLLPEILDQIRQSQAADWLGNGIGSSAAAQDPATALAYVEDAGTSSVIIRLALAGDANLDDAVDFADLVTLAQHYNSADTSHVWTTGDFNYDGQVTFEDLTLLAQNYNTAQPAAVPGATATFNADLAQAFAQVPEPFSISFTLLASCFVHRRRRHTSR
jgi:hypothetical protein